MRFTVLLLLSAIGCGESSKGPSMAKPIDGGSVPAAQQISVNTPKPAATTPAAQSILNDLIMAHTGSNPPALAAFRNCLVKREGELNQGSTTLPASCVERYTWPDRARIEWKFATNPIFLIQGDSVKMATHTVGGAIPTDVTPNQARETLEDVWATWMTLLVPLSEKLVAETVPETPMGTKAVRVWSGSLPPHVLIIDAKSNHLKKVIFEKQKEIWTFVLDDLKPVNGVLLPHKLTYTPGKNAGAVWNAVTYEVVSSFPEGTFTKP